MQVLQIQIVVVNIVTILNTNYIKFGTSVRQFQFLTTVQNIH